MKIEVIVAAMYQTDDSLYEKMNLKTDSIIANQSNDFLYKEYSKKNNCKLKIITTQQRGVGKNRNIGLIYSEADICLFSDQDMIYVDNYDKIIIEAFQKIPNADIIIFNIETLGEEIRARRTNKKIKKINKFNCLNYGAARIAVKRKVLFKKNIWFSLLYGGGAPYSSGEDSLFLLEALKKGMSVYTFPEKIADTEQSVSTWFDGYTKKYFEDKGYWIANAFPKIKYFVIFYFFLKLRNKNKKLKKLDILKALLNGSKKFRSEKCYHIY